MRYFGTKPCPSSQSHCAQHAAATGMVFLGWNWDNSGPLLHEPRAGQRRAPGEPHGQRSPFPNPEERFPKPLLSPSHGTAHILQRLPRCTSPWQNKCQGLAGKGKETLNPDSKTKIIKPPRNDLRDRLSIILSYQLQPEGAKDAANRLKSHLSSEPPFPDAAEQPVPG